MSYRLPGPEEKARYVREKFDQIAAHYDLFNDLITQGQHRWWKRQLVRRLGIGPGARVLDLCCGTGDIAARSLGRVGPAGRVVALDFSAAMLAIARQRLARQRPSIHRLAPAGRPAGAQQAPAPCVTVLRGDAMRLPFAAGSFDFVTVGYGLRNVTDLDLCLGEIRRVLAPGGGLASLDVGKVRPAWARPLADFYMFRVVPWIGRRLQPGQEMFEYLPHSAEAFPSQDALKARLLAAGFASVELIEHLLGASVIHLARTAP
ncbi:MAG: ubiquinone/menaquinone biosynthesis methyltransferase [Candidatus Lambdaproteobacteria bacterium]|nr:ubiquinone/menaquinone biosynthesis methyltransferase [Candidatus Lambdaproteobacteria bacterium]